MLRLTRAGVAWQATGCARGAYEHALAYAASASSSARRSPVSSSSRTCWSGCWPTSPPRPACAPGCPQLQQEGLAETTIRRWPGVLHGPDAGDGRLGPELLGGNGILLENHVGRFVADSEAIYSYEGTREINTLIVGRAITGLSAFV